MPTLETKSAKYAEWLDTATFDNCKLNRKEYGEFLASYIIGEKDGFVLNLNGEWGTGKTEFLKRFYSHLLVQGHPTIYIDAWESDFSKDPLTVVSSELMTQLEKLNDNIGTDSGQLKSFLGKALKGSLIGLGRLASAKLFNDGDYGADAVSALLEENSVSFTEQLSEQYTEQIEAIRTIREQLTQLAEVLESNYGAQLPVVVLVDELDRCRPTYAIEMLEVIKHFFNTPKFVFVVATDTDQLSHSVKAVYGNDFNANQYLKRFFDRKAALSVPDIMSYLLTCKIQPASHIEFFPILPNNDSYIESIIEIVVKGFNLKIRDIDQLISKMNSIIRYANYEGEKAQKRQVINLASLLLALVEFDRNSMNYKLRTQKHISGQSFELEVEDWNIDNDLTFKLFYQIAFDTIILVKRDSAYKEEIFLPKHIIKMEGGNKPYQNAKDYVTSWNIRQYANASRYLRHKSPEIRYWLWNDIKKAVELSGYLE